MGIKGYKAFNKDMKCRGFQYEEGQIYEMEEEPNCCNNGFHFCENPLDTLNYYDLCNSEFAEVEAIGDIDKGNDDTKMATNKIKIGAKLDLKGFIKASFDFLWEKCKINDIEKDKMVQASSGEYSQLASSGEHSKLASSGEYSQLASSGEYSQLASSGEHSKLASSGDNSKLASSGYNSQLASSGCNSKLASSGYNSQLASSGDYSKLASSGYNSQLASSGKYSQLASSGYNSKLASSGYNSKLASSGYNSQLASSGDYSQLASSGEYSNISHDKGIENVVCNIGICGKAKGKKGDILVLAEYERLDLPEYNTYVYKPICVKSKKIDGKTIKEDAYYKLENKKFVEADND
jgi:hypothetical protein